jgi:hypothetical protein
VEPLLTESSALYTLYDFTINLQGTDEAMRFQILSSMEPLSKRIAEFSKQLFGDGNGIDYGTLSPYVPYSLYQSAVVQHRLWNQTGHEDHKSALASLKEILGHFRKRWLIAGNDKCSCNNTGICQLIQLSRSIFGCFGHRLPNVDAAMARLLIDLRYDMSRR